MTNCNWMPPSERLHWERYEGNPLSIAGIKSCSHLPVPCKTESISGILCFPLDDRRLKGRDDSDVESSVLPPIPVSEKDVGRASSRSRDETAKLASGAQTCLLRRLVEDVADPIVARNPFAMHSTCNCITRLFFLSSFPLSLFIIFFFSARICVTGMHCDVLNHTCDDHDRTTFILLPSRHPSFTYALLFLAYLSLFLTLLVLFQSLLLLRSESFLNRILSFSFPSPPHCFLHPPPPLSSSTALLLPLPARDTFRLLVGLVSDCYCCVCCQFLSIKRNVTRESQPVAAAGGERIESRLWRG